MEICINKAWGTICDNGFSVGDARAVCNHLKVPFSCMKLWSFESCADNCLL